MRTNLFGGAVLGLLCLTATSFAGWDATDKALGHEGRSMRSNRVYRAMPAQQAYRSAPVMSAPVVVAAPAAVPQVAATISNTERRSFSVEPSAAPVMSNNAVYSAPRSYSNSGRVNNQPNYTQADTKIRGREGN